MRYLGHFSNVQPRLDYETKRDISGPKDRLQKSIEEDKQKLEQLRRKEKELKSVATSAQEEIDKLAKRNQGNLHQHSNSSRIEKCYRRKGNRNKRV